MAGCSLSWEHWKQLAAAAQYDSGKLAKLSHMSLRQLQRVFKRELGRSPQDMLNEQQLDAARQLLLSGKAVKEVALQLGYKHPNNFCRYFKAEMRMTTSQFVLR
jgi:AraC-like DNA-binding protein